MKKCKVGGKSDLAISCFFSFWSCAPSSVSASVKSRVPPVCIDASCHIRDSRRRGSGLPPHRVPQLSSRGKVNRVATWWSRSHDNMVELVGGSTPLRSDLRKNTKNNNDGLLKVIWEAITLNYNAVDRTNVKYYLSTSFYFVKYVEYEQYMYCLECNFK